MTTKERYWRHLISYATATSSASIEGALGIARGGEVGDDYITDNMTVTGSTVYGAYGLRAYSQTRSEDLVMTANRINLFGTSTADASVITTSESYFTDYTRNGLTETQVTRR